MKRTSRKLQLHKETLRTLSETHLGGVRGAIFYQEADTRAFSNCTYCTVAGGTSCDATHPKYTQAVGCKY